MTSQVTKDRIWVKTEVWFVN